MRTTLFSTLLIACGFSAGRAAEFQAPVRLEAGGKPVRVESPGYAAPCWADIDGDGKKDLLVGQFSQGKIRIFKNLGPDKLGSAKLATGEWLKAEGAVAEVPGVW
jgi:hypothetical protein